MKDKYPNICVALESIDASGWGEKSATHHRRLESLMMRFGETTGSLLALCLLTRDPEIVTHCRKILNHIEELGECLMDLGKDMECVGTDQIALVTAIEKDLL